MGQIQNAIDGLVTKSLAAAVGKKIDEASAEGKAYAAQENAAKALDEAVGASKEVIAAQKMASAKQKELDAKVGKYGLKVGYTEDGEEEILIPSGNKLSKNPLSRERQLNLVYDAQSMRNKAREANRYAMEKAKFKTEQYEAFKDRVELLAKKAKMDPSTLNRYLQAEEDFKTNVNYRDLQEILDGGKKNG